MGLYSYCLAAARYRWNHCLSRHMDIWPCSSAAFQAGGAGAHPGVAEHDRLTPHAALRALPPRNDAGSRSIPENDQLDKAVVE